MSRTLTLALPPESEHAFLGYGIARGLVDPRGLVFRQELQPIETLNGQALEGVWDVTAISLHAYAYSADRYVLSPAGTLVGDGYGPVVVSRRSLTSLDLDESIVAIPGERTTACLALKLFCPGVQTRVLPYQRIAEEVAKGNLDAGVLLHEGRVRYTDHHLRRIVDLGEWWRMETGLPLPLEGYAVRRSLDPAVQRDVGEVLRDSVRYALDHAPEAIEYARTYADGLDFDRIGRLLHLYVNTYAVELGERGEQAVGLLLQLGHEKGILPYRAVPEFLD